MYSNYMKNIFHSVHAEKYFAFGEIYLFKYTLQKHFFKEKDTLQ